MPSKKGAPNVRSKTLHQLGFTKLKKQDTGAEALQAEPKNKPAVSRHGLRVILSSFLQGPLFSRVFLSRKFGSQIDHTLARATKNVVMTALRALEAERKANWGCVVLDAEEVTIGNRIKPVLNILGYDTDCFVEQQSIPGPDAHRLDMFLFARPEKKQQYLHVFGQRAERNTFENMTGSIAKFNVIVEAKPEELADLDKAAPQIQSYLRRTAAPFGILTNGRCWQLYP